MFFLSPHFVLHGGFFFLTTAWGPKRLNRPNNNEGKGEESVFWTCTTAEKRKGEERATTVTWARAKQRRKEKKRGRKETSQKLD